jgi:hypothetical protein
VLDEKAGMKLVIIFSIINKLNFDVKVFGELRDAS